MLTHGVYNLKQQARALAAVLGDVPANRFVVGTASVRETNEIHIVDFDDDTNALACNTICEHPDEIWDISPCPWQTGSVFTTHSNGPNFRATLWRLPEITQLASDESEPSQAPLEKIFSLPVNSRRLGGVRWCPSEGSKMVMTLEDRAIGLWTIDGAVAQDKGKIWGDSGDCITEGCWDPHNNNSILTVAGNNLHTWDLRSSRLSGGVKQAHRYRINDLDCNPNRPNIVVTGGDDYSVRFWDLRKPDACVSSIMHHTHWVTRVKYNRFHDQLLMSASADHTVALWLVPSLSAAPVDSAADETKAKAGTKDELCREYKDHEESVYGIAWSACDGWVYATLSYNGRLVVGSVPATDKYKILL
eukprot:c5134_g1_i2.p1 GENE.c5134_g1_i2~~c5134_g1_i2.p1  ORF type:complete len:360 (+),score=60.25 c5134_g1_i2:42-1121(+)